MHGQAFFGVIFPLLAGVARASESQLDIVWLNETTHDQLAVCNDGSSSAYYIHEINSPSASQDLWLFDLQGGGQCYSKETCDTRDTSMKSSNGYAPHIKLGGIFDDEEINSPFFSANKVFVPYCTSDGWVGDAPASETTWGYEFRGQRVIRSAIDDLVAKGKITSASRIMFAGQSAGGRGVMNNVDLLPAHLPAGATVLGAILDSPYYLDIEPYTDSFVGFQNQTMEIYNRYNVAGSITDACAAVHTNASGNGWKCLYGQYRIPFLRTPYLLIASQFDSYQLSNNIGENPVNGAFSSPEADQYARYFATATKQLLQELHVQTGNGRNGYFSWACYNHAVSESSLFYTATSLGAAERDASKLLLQGVSGAEMSFIEDCGGELFCGADCT